MAHLQEGRDRMYGAGGATTAGVAVSGVACVGVGEEVCAFAAADNDPTMTSTKTINNDRVGSNLVFITPL